MTSRMHLFEFGDQEWLPEAWRRYITEYLQFMLVHGPFDGLPALVSRVAEGAEGSIVDLCSGSGGPWEMYLEEPLDQFAGVEVVLTDLRPNAEAFERIEQTTDGRASGYDRPVDATDVPAELEGPRTIINAFHHFRPETARSILADAVDRGEPIGVFEVMDRRLSTILSTLLVPLFVVLMTPFARPFRIGRIFWTYLIPVMPLLIFWDGLVSALRTYSPAEMLEMVEAFDDYDWEAGRVPAGEGPGPARITYLVGRPLDG